MKVVKIVLDRNTEKELENNQTYLIDEFILNDYDLDYNRFDLEEENKEGIILISAPDDPNVLNTTFNPNIGEGTITIDDVQVHPHLAREHLFKFKKLENLSFKEEYNEQRPSSKD